MEKNTGFIKKGLSAARVEVYSEANYGGEKGAIPRGRYQVTEKMVKSLKLTEFCRVTFYDNDKCNGKSYTAEQDEPDLKLDFKPVIIVVETYAKGIIKGQADKLFTGEYEIEELAKYDKLELARGFYALFGGKEGSEHTVNMYMRGECSVKEMAAAGYTKVQLFVLGDEDICLNYTFSDELSDDDLIAVAGGSWKGFLQGVQKFWKVVKPFVVPLIKSLVTKL